MNELTSFSSVSSRFTWNTAVFCPSDSGEAQNVAVYMAPKPLIWLSMTIRLSVAFQKNPPFSLT